MTDDRLQHLHEVAPLLWPAPLRLHDGPAAPGDERAAPHAEYLVLPSRRRPRLLVPPGPRAAAGALRRYGVGRGRSARWSAMLLAMGARTGLGPLLGHPVRVLGTPGPAGAIEAHLAAVLDRDVVLSMHLGAPRANRKPVLQVLDPGGRTLAFVKVGVNELTRRLVRDEAETLRSLEAAGLTRVTVASVLHSGQWQGLELLVQSALPVGGGGGRPDEDLLHAAQIEVAALAPEKPQPLAGSRYWVGLVQRLAALPPGPAVPDLADLVPLLERRLGDVELPLGAWHGDWTPWNCSRRDGRLLVWDWERFSRHVPMGFDALHWSLQRDLVNRLARPRAAADRLLSDPPSLAAFGLDREQARAAAAVYLVEIAVRYLGDRQQEAGARLGDVSAWLLPAVRAAVDGGPRPPALLNEERGTS